jgi:predicted metal-binding protein
MRDIHDYDALAAQALALGAVQAKVVPVGDLVVENRVTLKCRFGCPHYGRSHSCPPFVPTVDEFRAALGEYSYALLVAFPSDAYLPGGESLGLMRRRRPEGKRAQLAPIRELKAAEDGAAGGGTRAADEGLERTSGSAESAAERAGSPERDDAFWRGWDASKQKAFQALLELERAAFAADEPLALALRPSRCTLCDDCDPNEPCRHPTRLRFSPESVGVNLAATCRQARMDLVFPFKDTPSHIGIVLLG